MTWKPIVAGVDDSDEGVHAARTAVRLARTAKVQCHLVHAVRDPWADLPLSKVPRDMEERNRLVLASARATVEKRLKGEIPASLLRTLDVRYGRTAVVLGETAARLNADLVVVGGKHHSAIGRWLAGSTAHYLVRAHDRPVLVAIPGPDPALPGEGCYQRVLAAVDLSAAAPAIIAGAERFTRLFGAKLAVLHAVEPVPMPPAVPLGLKIDLRELSEAELERSVWPRIRLRGAERMVRRGATAPTIADVVQEWKADLLVVGARGSAWLDRVLLGTVTERLLGQLPTSILVLPGPAPTAARRQRAKSAHPRKHGRRP